jgi:peptide-methionine (S)-S-oxide reductase
VSYGQLLQIFFSVVHDPTQLNRQGLTPAQYRSAIFATSPASSRQHRPMSRSLTRHTCIRSPSSPASNKASFYPAELYHQDFMTENPRHPYIVFNDLPKVNNLKRLFPDRYRSDPVLTKKAHP